MCKFSTRVCTQCGEIHVKLHVRYMTILKNNKKRKKKQPKKSKFHSQHIQGKKVQVKQDNC